MKKLIYTLPEPLVRAKVLHRPPSKINKSPYLAEILLEGEECFAHTPALGCGGLVATNSIVWVCPSPSKDTISKYIVFCAEDSDGKLIGIHPTISNTIIGRMLLLDIILKDLTEIRNETACTFEGQSCRFDFSAIDSEGRKVFIEVKNVSLAIEEKPSGFFRSAVKTAIFPYGDGRKKPNSKPISPRALNQIQIMTKLSETRQARCIVIYLTQRTDCKSIRISEFDTTYREAVCIASHSGVEIMGIAVEWRGSSIYFDRFLEVV